MNALTIENLRKTYNNQISALKGISLTVKQGDFFALLGPNGAGKSTTIGIITSLVKKTSGRVLVFDQDIDRDFSKARQFLGVVPQEFNFNMFESLLNILVYQAGYYGVPRKEAKIQAEKYLKRLDLWDRRNHPTRELSGGMKRRFMIARALLHDPRLLILDEPTAGVDIELRRDMWNFLQEINREGRTLILTTHYLEEAENLCNHVAIIDHGEIILQNTMHSVVRELQTETYVLDLAEPLSELPVLENVHAQLIYPTRMEVDVHQNQTINLLFERLQAKGISVVSMKNKVNRLEEIFVRLTGKTKET